jgi:hypothetical protein
MAVVGECGSAKEVVMAVQEAVEQLERLLDSFGDDDAQQSDDKEERTSLEGKFKLNSPITQLTILIELYGSCKFLYR